MIDINILQTLAGLTADLDLQGNWPAQQLELLKPQGIPGWVIPPSYGGCELNQVELLQGYEELSAACLTSAFILTQRNAACQRIAASENLALKEALLPDLAAGTTFSTVGISHLTTSRQHLQSAAVKAVVDGATVRLSGRIPWVTGAAHAEHIVTGGTCDDGRQVLVVLPTDRPGITIGPSAKLMALTASHTASVDVNDVELPVSYLLAGPVEKVMSQGTESGTGSLTTSVLALGLAQRVARLIREHANQRPDLTDVSNRFKAELLSLHNDLYHLARHPELKSPLYTSSSIRQRANSLALRISQAALGICKGAGFVSGHPADLAVREAMFFLVWSCPQPVVQGVLDELACRGEESSLG